MADQLPAEPTGDPTGKPRPRLTPQAEAARQARAERQAAALRANLRRRKDQARARVSEDDAGPVDPSPDQS
jgi:hypothetical protein